MANLPQDFSKEDRPDVPHVQLEFKEDLTGDGLHEPTKTSENPSRESSPASSALTTASSAVTGSTNPPPLSMPHPKKFSHVNIGRKFLTSAPANMLSGSPILKTAIQKPATQAASSYSRLVTAKLTATPQPSGGNGWSRPPSAIPSNAPTPLPPATSKPTSAAVAPHAPLPPGKIIQPQPRGFHDVGLEKKDGSTKPAWVTSKGATVAPLQIDGVQTDFPTAAEVAQGRILKITDKKGATDAATAHKQAVMAELIAEEDTFRGVHLDPNAHHWDEMEEDDDNFLAGVIEFEDGRQYKVQPTQAPRQSSPREKSRSLQPSEAISDELVSKEDRFADDFDRSWPRSRTGSNHGTAPLHEQYSNGPSPTSTSAHSPQESSKVLFNERSNRLEPYSQQRHGGLGMPSPFNQRNSRSEHSTNSSNTIEHRRDAPPHAQLPGVQLIQKGPFSGTHSHGEVLTHPRGSGERPALSPVEGPRFRDRPPPRRDQPTWQGHERLGPDHIRSGPYAMRQYRDTHTDGRPRLPVVDSSNSNRRQLPPHMSSSGKVPPPARTDSDILPHSPVPPQAELPEPSASSQSAESLTSPSLAVLPIADLEEARKAAMHTAAERARLRRQQEEEERNKEKERARRKADEIEERMKASEQAKNREQSITAPEKERVEAQVVGIIEEAISSVTPSGKKDSPMEDVSSARAPIGRPPSSRGSSRSFLTHGTSHNSVNAGPSSSVDSWRRKDPQGSPSHHKPEQPTPSVHPVLHTPLLAHANLDVKEGENVDIVDFADMGKLVGQELRSQPVDAGFVRSAQTRAVAADFFDDLDTSTVTSQVLPPKAEEGPWRRQQSFHSHTSHAESLAQSNTPSTLDDGNEASQGALPHLRGKDATLSLPAIHSSSYEDYHRRLSGHQQNGVQKVAQGPHYREAPMAILEDVISRVKGAIASAAEAPKDVVRPQTWLPPAKRPKSVFSELAQPGAAFAVTSAEPPDSPRPAWNLFTVHLASSPRPILPPLRTELVWPRNLRYLRLEVHSFEVLNRRSINANDLIFDQPRLIEGRPKCVVSLPRPTRRPGSEITPISPIVNLPLTPPRPRIGISKEAGLPTWRKPPVSPTVSRHHIPKEDIGLDTVSRSPPPEAPSSTKSTSLPVHEADMDPDTSSSAALPNSGAHGDRRLEKPTESQPPAQFIVTSGTEGKMPVETRIAPSMMVLPLNTTNTVPTASREITNGSSTSAPQLVLPQWSKSPKSPIIHLKESPARAPDPEHLKAVWSQTPDKGQSQPINSLKGIADDLIGVPFSLQDVKSEDGVTPPPSGPGPWQRMSAYEVTRAFQQVPTSSSSIAQRPPVPIPPPAPSTTNGALARSPNFAGPPLPVGQPTRPAYSPMMSHASPVMYTPLSPVPGHMVVNGTAPTGYVQPVWVHGPPHPSGGIMRSPYLVPYPTPSGIYPPPIPGMQNPPPQTVPQARPGPGMPLVSPVMRPALPPMYGSPVLVHAHPVAPQPQGYAMSPTPANRAAMRPYDQHPHTQHGPMRPAPPQIGYNPNYARPPW